MRPTPQPSLSSREVQQQAAGLLQKHLQLKDHGYRCSAAVLLNVLFYAAARVTSLADACQRLRGAPSGDALRQALRAQLPDQAELERRLNRSLQDRLPKSLRQKRRPLVIDLTLIPYHGQPQAEARELRRSKPKAGTTRFHSYATLYVVRRGERFSVALTYVWQDDRLADVVQRLLARARRAGLKPRYLLLDREFYSLDVVAYLQAARCPLVVPVVFRGRQAQDPSQAQGPQRFRAWKRSGFSAHRLRHGKRSRQVRIAVSVKPFTHRGQYRRKVLVYAYWGFQPSSPLWIRQEYRRRFGIESSYRQLNQARIRTSSRDPRLRLLFVGLALVLRNLWVWLHRQWAQRRGRDGLQLHLARLRLRTLLLHLQHWAEAALGCTEPLDHQPLLE